MPRLVQCGDRLDGGSLTKGFRLACTAEANHQLVALVAFSSIAMTLSTKLLRTHIRNRDLVNIRREGIDSKSMQGVLLDCSDSLVLLQYIYDFRLDGYMLLRRCDLSEVGCRSTDRFQRELLETEGVFGGIDFDFRVPIHSFEAFLQSRGEEEILVIEDELGEDPDFLIGTVAGVDAEAVEIRHFTGIARLVEPLPRLAIDRITCCQMSTSYIGFYQRHFDRLRSVR